MNATLYTTHAVFGQLVRVEIILKEVLLINSGEAVRIEFSTPKKNYKTQEIVQRFCVIVEGHDKPDVAELFDDNLDEIKRKIGLSGCDYNTNTEVAELILDNLTKTEKVIVDFRDTNGKNIINFNNLTDLT